MDYVQIKLADDNPSDPPPPIKHPAGPQDNIVQLPPEADLGAEWIVHPEPVFVVDDTTLWPALRQRAIDDGKPVGDVVVAALREHLGL